MADLEQSSIESRKKYVEAWNKTMIDIWQERINTLGAVDTGSLWRSPLSLPVRADGRFYDIELSQTFLEYGIWVDLGVGGELHHGDYEANSKYIEEHGKKRVRKPWFSIKYYSSVMNLRDFMADSLGREFTGMFCNALDSDRAKHKSSFYRRKGYS